MNTIDQHVLDYFDSKLQRFHEINDQIEALEGKIKTLNVALDDDEDGIVFARSVFSFHVNHSAYTAPDVNLPNQAVRDAAHAARVSMECEITNLKRERIKLREQLTRKLDPQKLFDDQEKEDNSEEPR